MHAKDEKCAVSPPLKDQRRHESGDRSFGILTPGARLSQKHQKRFLAGSFPNTCSTLTP